MRRWCAGRGTMATPSHLDAEHVAWCAHLFESLKDGGSWGIPRSQMVFVKRGDSLVLDFPGAGELDERQAQELRDVREHFGAAGIEVKES